MEGIRAVLRFREGEKEKDVYIDLTPVVVAIEHLESTLTTQLDEILVILKNAELFTTGQKLVDTANTPVQLPNVKVANGKAACIYALPTNVGDVYYGGSQSEASGKKFPIPAGESRTMKVTNLENIWINADNASDGVAYGLERG